ncbi:MAG: rhodanese-like domain-containing protein [Dehalococcoidia bacterium]|nr:rhodanese-like domain-containing protein [Dehalococcoidia bacterium]
MKTAFLLLVTILAIAMSTACGQADAGAPPGQEVRVDGGSYRDIAPAKLREMLEKKDFTLVNVHIPYEGEITGTDLFVPYNQMEQNITRLPADKGARIVLYCRSGSMSTAASKTLVRLGFTNVWNLTGGMIEWKRQGYPLASTAK